MRFLPAARGHPEAVDQYYGIRCGRGIIGHGLSSFCRRDILHPTLRADPKQGNRTAPRETAVRFELHLALSHPIIVVGAGNPVMMRVPYLFVVQMHYENRVPPIPFIAPGSPVVRLPYFLVIV